MIVQFELNGILFEYDLDKAVKNWNKHKILFEQAGYVFFDPTAVTKFNREHMSEKRWQTIGFESNRVILFVVYTERENDEGKKIYRLISARKASKRERK